MAIIAANDGDTVQVKAGTYNGFTIDKAVSIIGQPMTRLKRFLGNQPNPLLQSQKRNVRKS